MKGTRDLPKCGFSNYVAAVLKFYGIRDWKDVDVLADAGLKEGLTKYSQWHTFPQLYVKGQFVGGHDVVKEMH